MNIAILGAGAMGSLFGGLLAEAGASVTLLDIHQPHLDAIRQHGLRLDTRSPGMPVRTRILPLAACRPDDAYAVPELLLICTKTHQIPAALASVRHLPGPDTWVLTLQSGLGNVEALSAFVPRERILVGVTTLTARLAGPGHVASCGAGEIRMGFAARRVCPDHPGHRPFNQGCRLCQVVDLFHFAGLRAVADPNIQAAVWERAACNAACDGLCAVTRCTAGQLDAIPAGPALALAIVAEVIAVARASGIAADLERTQDQVLRGLHSLAAHRPPMLQDVLAGRRTEIDSIHGAIVRAARERAIPVPYTEMLWTLVSLIDGRAVLRSEPSQDVVTALSA